MSCPNIGFGSRRFLIEGFFVMKKLHFSVCVAMCFGVAASTAFAQSRAYATNEGSGSVSVIDTNTDTVISTIDTGGKPRGLALCKGSDKLFVSEQNSAQLWMIDPVKGEIEQRVQLGESPEALYCSPDGKWLGVANEGTNSISFIEVKSMKLKFSIPVHGKNPEHGVFSPDGKYMFVSAEEADQVDVLDLRKRRQIGSVKVGERPRGIAFTPDSKRAFVAVESGSMLVAIDVTKREVIGKQAVGKRTAGVIVSPDGAYVFASNGGDANVSMVDAKTFELIENIAIGQRPWNMGFSADGSKLYVAAGRSGAISVIDLASRKMVSEIPVGKLPWGVVAH
jgi:YVTN family beta-propeller protein